MNRTPLAALVLVLLAGLVVALALLRRPAAPAAPRAPAGPTAPALQTATVPSRVLEGGVDLPDLTNRSRVTVLLGDAAVADAPVSAGRYRLELPGRVEGVALTPLADLELPRGPGRLEGSGAGASARVLVYQDESGNGAFEPGEPKLEAGLLKGDADPEMRGFFAYRVVLLTGAARLEGERENASGNRGWYRYNLSLEPGWGLIESELGSGYDLRAAPGSAYSLVVPYVPSGGGAAPTFAP